MGVDNIYKVSITAVEAVSTLSLVEAEASWIQTCGCVGEGVGEGGGSVASPVYLAAPAA